MVGGSPGKNGVDQEGREEASGGGPERPEKRCEGRHRGPFCGDGGKGKERKGGKRERAGTGGGSAGFGVCGCTWELLVSLTQPRRRVPAWNEARERQVLQGKGERACVRARARCLFVALQVGVAPRRWGVGAVMPILAD